MYHNNNEHAHGKHAYNKCFHWLAVLQRLISLVDLNDALLVLVRRGPFSNKPVGDYSTFTLHFYWST